ncbi:hypothetical protein J6590_030976, partial [Homalodisca vitripennis]
NQEDLEVTYLTDQYPPEIMISQKVDSFQVLNASENSMFTENIYQNAVFKGYCELAVAENLQEPGKSHRPRNITGFLKSQ